MASISKTCILINVYINYSTIKMETVDVKSSAYFDFNKENNEKYPNFEVGDHVKISKYKNHMLLVM